MLKKLVFIPIPGFHDPTSRSGSVMKTMVGRCHVWTPKDELFGHLSGVSSDCPGTRGLIKDNIHLLGCQLSLYCDAFWVKKCRGHVLTDDDEDVPGKNRVYS